MNNSLKMVSPLLLVIYFSTVLITPSFCQGSADYIVSAPETVDKGSVFDVTVQPLTGKLDPGEVRAAGSGGFSVVSASALSDGSIDCKIQAPSEEGSFDLTLNISPKGGTMEAITRTVSVQKSYWEAMQPVVIVIGVLVVLAYLVGGMKSSGSSSAY